MLRHKLALTAAALGLLLLPATASAQRFGIWYGGLGLRSPYYGGLYPGYGLNGGYYGGFYPGYYSRPWGYPAYYGGSFAYPYSYGYSAYTPYTSPYYSYSPGIYTPSFTTTGTYPAVTPPSGGSAAGAPSEPVAHLVVRVPKRDAEIIINGNRMKQTGTTRRFVSGRIRPGKKRTYKVTAEWTDNGHDVKETKKVVLRAGQHKAIRFKAPAAEQKQSDQDQADHNQDRREKKGAQTGTETGRDRKDRKDKGK
jgi:uncharacterized protein (TIGR03000 family)